MRLALSSLILILATSAWGQIYNPAVAGGSGTVTNIATTAPVGGGPITTTGTITCTTCATTTNGGALSGTAPVTISAAGAIACATCATTTNGGALSGTAPITVSVAGAIACTTCVVNNGTNTGTTAITLDLSAATTANAFKAPVGAGLTSGADGAIAYDSTNKNTHIRMNGADAIAVGEASALGVSAIPKAVSATLGQLSASSITDNGTVVATAEVLKIGTAGGNPHQDLTFGFDASAMSQQTSATCTNVTGMTWTINATKNYRLQCEIPVTFAASATLQFCLGGPGTPTSYNLDAFGLIGASAVYADINTVAAATYGTKTSASGAPGAVTEIVHVNAFIQNGSTASGTALTLQTAANGTNGITVGANDWCDLKQVN